MANAWALCISWLTHSFLLTYSVGRSSWDARNGFSTQTRLCLPPLQNLYIGRTKSLCFNFQMADIANLKEMNTHISITIWYYIRFVPIAVICWNSSFNPQSSPYAESKFAELFRSRSNRTIQLLRSLLAHISLTTQRHSQSFTKTGNNDATAYRDSARQRALKEAWEGNVTINASETAQRAWKKNVSVKIICM